MGEKEALELIIKAHDQSNDLVKKLIDRWTGIFIAACIAFVIITISITALCISCTRIYFETDYVYPTVEQSVDQTVEIGKE